MTVTAAMNDRMEPDEHRLYDVLSWSVIPALPGTRIQWEADWCKEGSVPVHAWLIKIDVIVRRSESNMDTSCVNGYPMVVNAGGELQPADHADIDGKPGAILEPRSQP